MGAAGVAYDRQAAEQLLALRDSAQARDVIDTALAMFILGEQRPHRFKSDRAFACQLSRRVRGLAEVNAGKHPDPKTGRIKRTYKDVPPAVLARLAESLKSAFGVAGLRLAELELRDLRAAEAEKTVMHDALREMS